MVRTPHLKAVRLRRGMPRTTLAARAGVGRGAVYRAESDGLVQFDTALRFARALEVPITEIAPDAASVLAEVS